MEKRINSSCVKDHNIFIGAKSSSKHGFLDDLSHKDGDFMSWPPRCYTCTFCKREFRSAQALGGHMNVHRRDRARLRQISSSQNLFPSTTTLFKLNLHRNPNTYFPSQFSSNLLSPSSLHHDLSRSSPSCDVGGENLTTMKSCFGFCKLHGFPCENCEGKIAKKNIVRWDLEIGLLGESKSDDLDLELRLGCS